MVLSFSYQMRLLLLLCNVFWFIVCRHQSTSIEQYSIMAVDCVWGNWISARLILADGHIHPEPPVLFIYERRIEICWFFFRSVCRYICHLDANRLELFYCRNYYQCRWILNEFSTWMKNGHFNSNLLNGNVKWFYDNDIHIAERQRGWGEGGEGVVRQIDHHHHFRTIWYRFVYEKRKIFMRGVMHLHLFIISWTFFQILFVSRKPSIANWAVAEVIK